MESRLIVKELIRYTTYAYYKKKNYPISETSFLKIFYKLKKEVMDTPLEDVLQFYWYEHGPYSPLLLKIKAEMITEQIIQETNRKLKTEKSRIIPHDNFIQKIRDYINQIIGDSSSDSSSELINEIYTAEAPYRFYLTFKSRFEAALDNFYRDPNTHIKPNQLIVILEETIGDLPNEPLFSNFKFIFLDFVELLTTIVEAKKINDFGDKLKNCSDEIFKTFAKGVRILHHDRYYEPEVESWITMFNDSLSNVEKSILNLYVDAKQSSIKNLHVATLEEIIQAILTLKSEKKLAMVSFLPSVRDESINYGSLDATIFDRLSDMDFKGLILQNCNKAKRAIIDKVENDDLNAVKYRIIAT